jgi:hypothetical protein
LNDVDDKLGGRSTPICGGVAAGRQEAAFKPQKTQTWTLALFDSFQPTATAVGWPSPFEPLKEWVCDWSLTTWVLKKYLELPNCLLLYGFCF